MPVLIKSPNPQYKPGTSLTFSLPTESCWNHKIWWKNRWGTQLRFTTSHFLHFIFSFSFTNSRSRKVTKYDCGSLLIAHLMWNLWSTVFRWKLPRTICSFWSLLASYSVFFLNVFSPLIFLKLLRLCCNLPSEFN